MLLFCKTIKVQIIFTTETGNLPFPIELDSVGIVLQVNLKLKPILHENFTVVFLKFNVLVRFVLES